MRARSRISHLMSRRENRPVTSSEYSSTGNCSILANVDRCKSRRSTGVDKRRARDQLFNLKPGFHSNAIACVACIA